MRLSKRLLPLILLAVLSIGCRHNVNTNNPKVVEAATLLDASNTCVTVEDGLTAADHALDQIKTLEPAYYGQVQPLLRRISSANVVAAKKIQAVKNGETGDWRGAVLSVAESVNIDDLNAAGVKNPNSQLIVSASLATLVGVLKAIPNTFGGTK